MARTSRTLSLALILLALGTLLTGCLAEQSWFGQRRRNFEGSAEAGHAAYTYHTFTGEEAWVEELEAGQTLVINYEVAIRKGVLSLSVSDPAGAGAWRETLAEDSSGTARIEADTGGEYRIAVRGVNTGGGFDVSWVVED